MKITNRFISRWTFVSLLLLIVSFIYLCFKPLDKVFYYGDVFMFATFFNFIFCFVAELFVNHTTND